MKVPREDVTFSKNKKKRRWRVVQRRGWSNDTADGPKIPPRTVSKLMSAVIIRDEEYRTSTKSVAVAVPQKKQ